MPAGGLRRGMNKKLLIVGAIAVFAATATTLFFYSVLAGRFAGGEQAKKTVKVLVAARDLPRGTRLADADLTVEAMPESSLPPGALLDGDDVEGRYLATSAPAGQPILDSYFPSRETGGISAAIPPGQRAVSLHVEEYAGVTDLVEAGDRVDILVATGRRSPGSKGIKLSTLVENVEVLDTGRSADGKSAAPVVTVLIDTGEVEKVSLADQSGAVRLALRNPIDSGVEIVVDKTAKKAGAQSAPSAPPESSRSSSLASARTN